MSRRPPGGRWRGWGRGRGARRPGDNLSLLVELRGGDEDEVNDKEARVDGAHAEHALRVRPKKTIGLLLP